ncbi:MAG: epoxyqueuosine reductase [Candidatus Aminicenantes bacterium]|nr:epoxyqueuosine reductase [Candidatus Aminicenantes bacterium]
MTELEKGKVWLEESIRKFCLTSKHNSLKFQSQEKAWGEPLVGFSRGDDPFYQRFKQDIGSFYFTPEELFKKTYPEMDADQSDLFVISWILPQTEATKIDQRNTDFFPSERWIRSRKFGEEFNQKLRAYVESLIQKKGYKAAAPLCSPLYSQKKSPAYGRASNWSERHAAYVSGLGTFGLCDGLITPLGKAVRFGSVITNMPFPISKMPYADIHAYCLFHSNGTCKQCVDRCPVGALSEEGHDKEICWSHVHEVNGPYIKKEMKLEAFGCGLCQTGVPCESGIPIPSL